MSLLASAGFSLNYRGRYCALPPIICKIVEIVESVTFPIYIFSHLADPFNQGSEKPHITHCNI